MPTLPVSARVEAKLKSIVKKMGGGMVEIGFMEDATYADGMPVAQVAWWDEFGHGGNFPSPPRPFFRTMISKEAPGWPAEMSKWAKILNYDGPKVLAVMGQVIKGELEDSINNFSGAPLSPTTLRLREVFGNHPEEITLQDVLKAQRDVRNGAKMAGGTQAHPLIWTAHMLDSVTFRVMR